MKHAKKLVSGLRSTSAIAASTLLLMAPGYSLAGSATADNDYEERISELLQAMTVEEKVGQMTQVTLGALRNKDGADGDLIDADKLKEAIHKYHVGSILNTGNRSHTVDEWHSIITEIQDEALSSRIRVPVLYGIDAIHGANYTKGSTLFPHNIGLAAARDPSVVADIARATAKEVRASGIRWNFDPVVGVGRNPLWSRFEETFGEDSYLVGVNGAAAIAGYEEKGLDDIAAVASCMKHYIGYTDPANGKDRTPAYIPEVVLREHYLPPFEAAVRAGTSTVMINSGSVNGMPVHGSKYLLSDVLRDELGFEGLIVSDWEDVIRLHTRQNVAETPRAAVKMAVDAGLDMSMVPHNFSFAEHLVSLVRDGEVSEERIDRSVRIILRLKFRLGLFDNAYPEPGAAENFGKPEYKQLALTSARETITLLKNADGTLPLDRDARVLLAGPAANNLGALHGSWSYTWQGDDEDAYPEGSTTLLDAFQAHADSSLVSSMAVADFFDEANYDTDRLRELAADVDVIVLALGEDAYAESPGVINDLSLPSSQLDLAQAALATGKPVVYVLLEGRPRVLTGIVDRSAAVVQAYRPGSQGAQAIVDVLYGAHNPSGVLPFSYPRFTGDITPYDRGVAADVEQLTPGTVTRTAHQPQWPFGFGLSYTSFELSDLVLGDAELKDGEQQEVSVVVRNTGDRDGSKAVDLYVSDLYASLSPAAQKLRGSKKVFLRAGESTTVNFKITTDDLSFVNAKLKRVVESGRFRVSIDGLAAEFDYLPVNGGE